MRSGTITRRDLRPRRPTRGPQPARLSADVLPLVGAIVLGVLILLWVAGGFGFGGNQAVPVASPGMTQVAALPPTAGPTSQPTATTRPTPARSPEAKPQPTPTPSPTPSPTASPSPTPSPSPTSAPTPTPTPSPQPTPTAGPTAPVFGLIILEPQNDAIVNVPGVLVVGLASPGATVTWDRPLWFDDHTTADATGHWAFSIALGQGDNVLSFRIGDDVLTQQTITVRYQP